MNLAASKLRFAGWRAVWCAAAVCFALAAAHRAQAACGYYVVAQHPSESMVSNVDVMRSHATAPAAPGDCPCRGPNCRAHDSAPVAPAVTPTDSDQQFACFAVSTWHAEQPLQWAEAPVQMIASSVYPSTVDPPPRSRQLFIGQAHV